MIGRSKQWVKDHYADPRGLEKKVMPSFDHLGYGWLSQAVYSGKNATHPGLDLNGKGSGNMDLGDKLYAPVSGVVVYVYNKTGKNEGWGPLLVIEEKEMVETPPISIPGPTETPLETPKPPVDTNIPPLTGNASSDNVVIGSGTTTPTPPPVQVDQWWKKLVDEFVSLIRKLFKL